MATEILTPGREDPRAPRPSWLAGFLAISLCVHLGFYAFLARTPPPAPPPPRPVDMEIIERPKPPPPPPVAKPEPPRPIEKPKPPPKVRLPPPPKEKPPPPPPEAKPPPPNQPPPPQQKPVPINIGLSLSSTTQAGSFAAPVGNTMYGKPGDKAADPSASKAYQAPPAGPRFVPSYQVTEPPQVESQPDVRAFYPDEARKDGLEGQVLLQLGISADGHVTKAKVLKQAGHGFDEAAVKIALQKLRFRPARLNGEPVATEITYTLTFLLD